MDIEYPRYLIFLFHLLDNFGKPRTLAIGANFQINDSESSSLMELLTVLVRGSSLKRADMPSRKKAFDLVFLLLSADVLMSQNFCTGSIYLFLYSYVLGVLSLYILNITSPSIVWLIVVYYGIPEPLAYLSFLPVR